MSGRAEGEMPPPCEKSFLEHLLDLRRALVWSVAALAVGILAAVPLAPRVLGWIKAPLRAAGKDPEVFLRVIDVTGGLSVAMTVVLGTGALLSAPFILWALGWFVFPGLTVRERRVVLDSLGLAVALFVAGVAVGYRLILGVTLLWLLEINRWLGLEVEFFTVQAYVGFVFKLLLGFGLAFEYPIVVLALARVGLVTAAFLRGKRRHVAVLLLILAAVITPTVDPVTQVLLALPLYALYELCLLLVWALERQKARAAG